MPLPLAPIALFALRGTVVAAAIWTARRALVALSHPGRTDQRAEDALDDLGEGLSVHSPADREMDRQKNASARLRRMIRFRGQSYEIDAGLLARFRIRKTPE